MAEDLVKTISGLVDDQLPEFIRADHPTFKLFLEYYYQWCEDETKGNTVYHIMNAEKYRDIDETLDPFIRLFKEELLPYFPETSTLDLVKILKGAREFYVKKGSVDSVKWLFRVLFGIEVEIYYPKQQILIASDGKWKLPQAFQLTLSEENAAIDVNLLEQHKATGNVSKATCVIESANKTIDRTFGNEILEMYVSNVVKEFTNGEYLEILYTDENGVEQTFSEKIIGALSSIKIDSSILTDPDQKRRGLSYNIGDPVVVYGGLSDTPEANDAAAIVGNVTVGSIDGLGITFPGYGYRTYSNTEVIVYATIPGDLPGANTSTDIRVAGITELTNADNSNQSWSERIYVDKMPLNYADAIIIGDADWALLTANNRNIRLTISGTAPTPNDWVQYEDWYADSNGSYETANITGKFLLDTTGWTGAAITMIMYDVSNTHLNDTDLSILAGNLITSVNSLHTYTVDSVDDVAVAANANSQILQVLNFEAIDTGGIALYNIINGGYGFNKTPTITTKSWFATYAAEAYTYGSSEYATWRQPMGAYGFIAHIYIDNPGTAYANGDAITVTGRGYGFTGYVTVNATGSIIATTITNRGEGYYGNVATRTVSVDPATGSGAALSAYGFGEGATAAVQTGAIGRVRDVRLIYRGFDYISTPVVSFKVVDMVIDGIAEGESLSEGERVYQGATLETASFQGIIKSYNRTTKALRLFNYSGAAGDNFNDTLIFTSEGSVQFNVNTAAVVAAPSLYPASVRATGLPNPWFYGNGKAKGYAEFYQGLIKFPGFYLNTDGFLSADKKLQDARVYHNYSYVIESEKSLNDYQNVIKDIVHPIGMSMLSRTISKANLTETLITDSLVNIIGPVANSSRITVANTYEVIVTGSAGASFANTDFMSVGDLLLLIDPVATGRSQAKTIVAVDSDTSLNVESDFVYIGQGRLTTNAGNNIVYISGNTNTVSSFISTGDVIRINVGNTAANIELYEVTVGTGNTLTLNNTANTTNTNLVYQVVPDYISATYEYKVIRIPT